MDQAFTLPKGMNWAGRISGIAKFLSNLTASKNWEVVVRERRGTRSDQQNRWLNGCIYKRLMDATGYERDDISDYCCSLYWGEKEKRVPRSANYPRGIKMVPCRTTTTNEMGKRDVLTWDAFSDYVAFLQRHFAQEHGIYLPDPDPAWRENQEREAA